jgi:hypothetical protein
MTVSDNVLSDSNDTPVRFKNTLSVHDTHADITNETGNARYTSSNDLAVRLNRYLHAGVVEAR